MITILRAIGVEGGSRDSSSFTIIVWGVSIRKTRRQEYKKTRRVGQGSWQVGGMDRDIRRRLSRRSLISYATGGFFRRRHNGARDGRSSEGPVLLSRCLGKSPNGLAGLSCTKHD